MLILQNETGTEGNNAPDSRREPEQHNPPPEKPKGRRSKKSE